MHIYVKIFLFSLKRPTCNDACPARPPTQDYCLPPPPGATADGDSVDATTAATMVNMTKRCCQDQVGECRAAGGVCVPSHAHAFCRMTVDCLCPSGSCTCCFFQLREFLRGPKTGVRGRSSDGGGEGRSLIALVSSSVQGDLRLRRRLWDMPKRVQAQRTPYTWELSLWR